MTLREIIDRCSLLEVEERRHEDKGYSELVIYNKDIDAWHRVFSDVLEPPAKPAGEKPTKDLVRLTKAYGGIRTRQTLFLKAFDEVTVIAMFWPWEDGIHTTLKMILLEKQKEEVINGSPPGAKLSFSALRMALGKVLFHKPSQKPV